MKLPLIAVTMGDPAGIGPELALRILCTPVEDLGGVPIIFGSQPVLERVARSLGMSCAVPAESLTDWHRALAQNASPLVVDIDTLGLNNLTAGRFSADTGQASFAYIDEAIQAALNGRVHAVVTGPIQKEALYHAGLPYPGHTEIFAARTNSPCYCMMLTSPQITCSLVTTHIGLRDVAGELSRQRILEVIQLSADAMFEMRGQAPRIGVCGLNPHAGEHGLFGSQEEELIIAPAIDDARKQGIEAIGPLSPDTAFVSKLREKTDCYVCMYHDQGLIPFKALAFDTGVNITLGLPFVRTSPDHGTAMDIAWTGKAKCTSMLSAVALAARLSRR